MRIRGPLMILALACAAPLASAVERRTIDLGGLPEAILAETNREREAHGLNPLRLDPRLARAAGRHARFLMLLGAIRHESFLPGSNSVYDRVRAEGVRSSVVSENLASLPVRFRMIRERDDGNGIEVRESGEAAPDVEQLATRFVTAWLNSPGHRANLLNPKFTHLGCAAETGTGPSSAILVYSAQVFAQL